MKRFLLVSLGHCFMIVYPQSTELLGKITRLSFAKLFSSDAKLLYTMLSASMVE